MITDQHRDDDVIEEDITLGEILPFIRWLLVQHHAALLTTLAREERGQTSGSGPTFAETLKKLRLHL